MKGCRGGVTVAHGRQRGTALRLSLAISAAPGCGNDSPCYHQRYHEVVTEMPLSDGEQLAAVARNAASSGEGEVGVTYVQERYVAGMEQRISMVTLGVADVTRARRFYERLGWQGQEVEKTVFFQAGGTAIVLWGRDKLAEDAGIEDRNVDGFGGMALAHNVRSRTEVDEVLGEAANAGAEITRAARETFYGGYAGCFTDPDGHVWEIAYNPGFPLGQDGAIKVPDFGVS